MYLNKLHNEFSIIFGDKGLIPHKVLNSTEIKYFTVRFGSLEEKEFLINTLNRDLKIVCTILRESGNLEFPMELYYCKEDVCFYCIEHAPGFTTILRYDTADYGSLLYWFEELNIKEIIDILKENHLYNFKSKIYAHPIYDKSREFFDDISLIDFEKSCEIEFWETFELNDDKSSNTFRIGLLAHLSKTSNTGYKEAFFEYLSENYEVLFDYNNNILLYDKNELVFIHVTDSFKLGRETIMFRFFYLNNKILHRFRELTSEEELNKFMESNLTGIEFSLTSYLDKNLKEVERSIFYTQEDAVSAIYNHFDSYDFGHI